MLRDLGHEVSARGVAEMYRDFVDVFLLDEIDAHLTKVLNTLDLEVFSANTIMNSLADKRRVAERVLQIVAEPRNKRGTGLEATGITGSTETAE
jgi:LPPG:FO 2-phospho-L-lactate transferase